MSLYKNYTVKTLSTSPKIKTAESLSQWDSEVVVDSSCELVIASGHVETNRDQNRTTEIH